MQQKTGSTEIDHLIKEAAKKINAGKENDICRYIPSETGGYIHHFTMRKMRHENPEALAQMIKTYIINVAKPTSVPPKSRAARGSRKRRDQILFTKEDIDRMLHMARLAGDKDMIRKLTPKKDFKQIKKELLSSIRQGRVEHDLWTTYVELASGEETDEKTAQVAVAVK